MHADRWNGRDRMLTVEELQVNHCMTAMGFAFRARVDAGLATNATRRINEKRIGPDRSYHCRLHSHFAAARRHDYPVLILNIVRGGEPRVDLDARLRVLIHKGAYAARLRAG